MKFQVSIFSLSFPKMQVATKELLKKEKSADFGK